MKSSTSLAFIRTLAEKGHRIFSVDAIYPITMALGLKHSYVPQLLRRCVKDGSIHSFIVGRIA